MSDYSRTTRECLVSQLRPELLQAIQRYFQEHQLGDLEAEALLCCETISKKKSANWLVSWLNAALDETIYTGMLLTAQWLIWVRSGDRSDLVLTAANLKEIQVQAYTSKLTKDAGLEVSGYIEGFKGRVRGYIGLGPEEAAHEFCDAVRQMIEKVNPPRKRRRPKWLGG